MANPAPKTQQNPPQKANPEPQKDGRLKVSHKKFVLTWQASKSVQEVCDKLGIYTNYAYARARFLRKKGVPLKQFSRQTTDYAALAALCQPEEDEEIVNLQETP